MPYPLQVILSILGLPESDYARMLTLTQELFGATDPDLQRGDGHARGDRRGDHGVLQLLRRAHPGAHGRADRRPRQPDRQRRDPGEPMPALEKLGYYIIIATAGHDTTSASMSEGMAQLAKHPDQLELLRPIRRSSPMRSRR